MVESSLNYYEVLGVAKQASTEEIRKAYKDLAKKYHPDRLNGLPEVEKERLTEKMKVATNAYTTLKDEDSRKNYDRTLLMGSSQSDANPFSYYGSQSGHTRYYTYTTVRRSRRGASQSPLANLVNALFFLGIMGLIVFFIVIFLSAAWPFILILILISLLRSRLR